MTPANTIFRLTVCSRYFLYRTTFWTSEIEIQKSKTISFVVAKNLNLEPARASPRTMLLIFIVFTFVHVYPVNKRTVDTA